MDVHKMLGGYPDNIIDQVLGMLENNTLSGYIRKKYPEKHSINSNKALYDYITQLKKDYLKKSAPLSKVIYDEKIDTVNNALGLHTFISRVQGNRLKAKNEIRIASLFKNAPADFLRMIAVHELAHLKEKDHNKAFYRMCEYMEPDYHQIEFDLRLYLIDLQKKDSA